MYQRGDIRREEGRERARYGRFWGRIWFESSVFKSRRTCLIYGKRGCYVIIKIDV